MNRIQPWRIKTLGSSLVSLFFLAHAQASPLMSSEWADAACTQWNQTSDLTKGLSGEWIKNDGNKGFKVIHLFRNECGESTQVELRIAFKEGAAQCVYGGKVETVTLNASADYLMHADSSRWIEMGQGDYGPMKAMMFGRLEFSGPKLEAMSVMGPFQSFLLLVGKIPADTGSCPAT